MKILQILNPVIPLPAKTVGGSERIVEYLIDELLTLGHEVTFMGHKDSKLKSEVKHISIGNYLDKTTIKSVWMHLIKHKYDVVHNHGRLMHFAPIIWGSTRKIHTFHMADLDNKGFRNFLKMTPKNLTFTPCARWIQEKYVHIGGNWNYVNNGLPMDKYKFENTVVDQDAPLVIICRISPGKGIVDAIHIAIKTGKKLIIAGKIGDYEHEKEWFEQNVGQFLNNGQITFVGEIDDVQKNALLNTASALIIPTKDSEAFNTTMIEANACGCPVISYNKFCFPEFIVNGKNGFTGVDPKALVEAIGRLGEINRNDCRKHFEAHYNSKIMALNYINQYQIKV